MPTVPVVRSEPLSASIPDSLPDHIAVIDRDGRILCTNSAWRQFAERNGAPNMDPVSVGANYLDVCRRAAANGDGRVNDLVEAIQAVLDGSRERFTIEYECPSPEADRWFVMDVSPLCRAGGAVISHRDVTRCHQARRELQASYDEIVRLKGEVQQQLRFEALISEVSARFVDVSHGDVDLEIERALHRVLAFFGVDRCGLFEVAAHGKEIRALHMVVGPGIPSVTPLSQIHTQLPWTFAKAIQAGESLFLDDIDQLPGEAAVDRRGYASRGVRALALIPITVSGKVRYLMSASAVREPCAWPPGIAPRLQVLGETIVSAITRQAMERVQCELLGFQVLVADISARFVNLASDAVDEEMAVALQRILTFFNADQCGIFELNAEDGEAYLSYVQAASGVSPAPVGGSYARRFPWAYRELTEGRIVSFSAVDDLPPQAAADKPALERCGVRAALNVPISIGGRTCFALGLSCNRKPHSCPPEFIPRLRLLGETLANAVMRSEAEKAIKTVNTRLEYALDATVHGVWDWNVRTGEVYYSANWIESLGYAREEVPGHVSFSEDLVHPDDLPRVRQALLAHLNGDTPIYRVENRLKLKSGAYRWNLSHGRVVERAADGTPIRMVGTDTDITEQKRVEAEMRAMRDRLWHMDRVARIGMLSASLAHEINQPLAAISGNAQAASRLLAKPSVDLDEIREIVRDIERDDKRAADVISSLRAMLTGQAHHPETLDLAEVAHSVLQILHGELLTARITAETRLVQDCLVYGDKTRLQQVILNLIMNAVESMDAEPADRRTMTVSVSRAQSKVIFSVSDTGAGIASDKLCQIFEPFLTTKADGMGLGLAVSRSIVESHHGKIWAENNEGRGATFFVELPLAGQNAYGTAGH